MEPEPQPIHLQAVIQLMKITKKTNPLFKPLKKLKTALDTIGYHKVSPLPTKNIVAFHFGLGNQLDLKFLIQAGLPKQLEESNPILPGKSYCFLNFQTPLKSQSYLSKFQQFEGRPDLTYAEITYQNLTRVLIFMYGVEGQCQVNQLIGIESCPNNYEPNTIPGLIIHEQLISKEQEHHLLTSLDERKWERLNNRRVQHFGYEFKYGQNGIHKEQVYQNMIPQFMVPLLTELKKVPVLADLTFDQITVNDYFAGDGIPPHFDTHSPFEEVFVAVSMLSGLVMDFRRYNGIEKQVYLKERSMMIFSAEARYAWTHGISCRKMDNINGKLQHRSRRISITLRKIKRTPCTCPYYFYCDSQGYDQYAMKKNNPLLKKYLAEEKTKKLQQLTQGQIYTKYVEEAYDGFGYNFHNKVIDEVRESVQRDLEEGDLVLDVGCGNGEYRQIMDKPIFYFGIQKCTIMEQFQNKLHMDGLSLAFRNNIFDKVLCVAVLHHLPSKQTRIQMLTQIRKVLRIGGLLYLTVFNHQTKTHIYGEKQDILLQYCVPSHKLKSTQKKHECLREQKKGQVYERYYHLFKKQQIIDLVEEASLKPIKVVESEENISLEIVRQN